MKQESLVESSKGTKLLANSKKCKASENPVLTKSPDPVDVQPG